MKKDIFALSCYLLSFGPFPSFVRTCGVPLFCLVVSFPSGIFLQSDLSLSALVLLPSSEPPPKTQRGPPLFPLE